MINCTNCFSPNRPHRKPPKKPSPPFSSNPRIVVSPTAGGRSRLGKTSLSKVQKPKKSSAQFLIKFHQFSLRSPFCLNANKSNSNDRNSSIKSQNSLSQVTVNKGSPMNQRCCLSVSVVPSDKHNAKRRNVSLRIYVPSDL